MVPATNQEVGPHQNAEILEPWFWASNPLELWETDLLFMGYPVCSIFHKRTKTNLLLILQLKIKIIWSPRCLSVTPPHSSTPCWIIPSAWRAPYILKTLIQSHMLNESSPIVPTIQPLLMIIHIFLVPSPTKCKNHENRDIYLGHYFVLVSIFTKARWCHFEYLSA